MRSGSKAPVHFGFLESHGHKDPLQGNLPQAGKGREGGWEGRREGRKKRRKERRREGGGERGRMNFKKRERK